VVDAAPDARGSLFVEKPECNSTPLVPFAAGRALLVSSLGIGSQTDGFDLDHDGLARQQARRPRTTGARLDRGGLHPFRSGASPSRSPTCRPRPPILRQAGLLRRPG
jgi:hypothetical protein